MNELEAGVRRLAELLDQEHIPYMLIGGAAAAFWGNPRLTLDADVTVWVEPQAMAGTIERLLRHLTARSAHPLPFAKETRVLPVVLPNGLPADITFGQLPFEEEAIGRALPQDVAGYPVRICSVADLILHKVISDRPRDLEDVRFLIGRYRDSLDREALTAQVASLAEHLGAPVILETFLRDWAPMP